MNLIIKIPNELKLKFEEEKYEIKKRLNSNSTFKNLSFFLKNDMVVDILKIIEETSLSYNYFEYDGFFKEYKKWLDFSLKELMKTFRIDISTKYKERDIYLALYQSDKQLKEYGDKNIEMIIKRAEYFTRKDCVCYNTDIYNMCNLFVRIAFKNVDIDTLVDISYENYIKKTKDVFGISYEELCKLGKHSEDCSLKNFVKIK